MMYGKELSGVTPTAQHGGRAMVAHGPGCLADVSLFLADDNCFERDVVITM